MSLTTLAIEYKNETSEVKRNKIFGVIVKDARAIIWKQIRGFGSYGVNSDELYSVAMVSVHKALNAYNPEMSEFNTYLTHTLWKEMYAEVTTHNDLIHIPHTAKSRFLKQMKEMRRKMHENLEMDAEFQEILNLNQTASLDSANEDGESMVGNIKDENSILPDMATFMSETNTYLRNALEKLTERERKVLELTYIEDMSLRDIGGIMGVTYQCVKNWKDKAENNLRRSLKHVYA